ncbi:SPOC like C-terminal domain-containing protein [Dipodascopsis uninucleata]
MADKEATVFVIDLGESMGKSHLIETNGKSDIDSCLSYVYDKIGSKVLSERKTDVVGIVGVSTDETNNYLAVDTEAYNNISILCPIQQILVETFRTFPRLLRPSNTSSGDLISGIVIAIDMLEKYCRKLKYIKNIIVLSNCRSEADTDGVEHIIDKMASMNINLTIFTIGAYSDIAKQNHEILAHLIQSSSEKFSCALYPFSEVLPDLELPNIRKVKSIISYSGTLTIGDSSRFPQDTLVIPVERYPRVKKASPPSSCAYIERDHEAKAVSRHIAYEVFLSADEAEQKVSSIGEEQKHPKKDIVKVEPEELQKGYLYGRTIVPITVEDQQLLSFHSTKSLDLVGFIPTNTFPCWQLMGETSYILPAKTDKEAHVTMSCLVQAMFEMDVYGLARFVYRDNSRVQMVLLIPFTDDGNLCLVDCPLPFSEDIRTYKFPSLKIIRTIKGKILREHRLLPTTESVDLMRQYVQAMDVSDLSSEGNITTSIEAIGGYAAPGQAFDPVIAKINKAILQKALYPEKELSLTDSNAVLLKYSQPPASKVAAAASIADKLIASVNVKKVDKYRTNKRKYAGIGVPDNSNGNDNATVVGLDDILPPDADQKLKASAKRSKTMEDDNYFDLHTQLIRLQTSKLANENDDDKALLNGKCLVL